jgi:hypothetical protein
VTAHDEAATLASAWDRVRRILEDMPTSLRFGDVHYVEARDKAERVKSLGLHLEAAVSLMRSELYESAFALLRTCLEHVIVDWLVFQGRTLVKRFSPVSEETWQQWRDARADGAEWTRTIRDWHRTKKGQVRIVHEGIFSEPDEGGRRQQLSIYYFLLEQYRPTLGPPSQQVDDGLIGRDELRALALENRAIWEVYLTWSSLLTNLRENQLVDADDAGRLAVHYRFLSGYAHPVADQRRETYGRDAGLGWPRFDHYSSELILLYAITLGTLEVRNFLAQAPLFGRTLSLPWGIRAPACCSSCTAAWASSSAELISGLDEAVVDVCSPRPSGSDAASSVDDLPEQKRTRK